MGIESFIPHEQLPSERAREPIEPVPFFISSSQRRIVQETLRF
jgi:hypothetical protein